AAGATVYATYLGGTGNDGGSAIVVDSAGGGLVTRIPAPSGFSVTPPLPSPRRCTWTAPRGPPDPFPRHLRSSGRSQEHSTLIGGSGDESGLAITTSGSDFAVVGGQTTSSDHWFGVYGGNGDGFVTLFRVASPALGCTGGITLGPTTVASSPVALGGTE